VMTVILLKLRVASLTVQDLRLDGHAQEADLELKVYARKARLIKVLQQ